MSEVVKNIRKILDDEFNSVNTEKQFGKTYRAEQECDVLKEVYIGLLNKMKVKAVDYRHYKLIVMNHFDSVSDDDFDQ